MAAIATTADGNYIYLALEDASNLPRIVRIPRDDTSQVEPVYTPGAGTVANVMPAPGHPERMLFYGNFGTDVVVIMHDVLALANLDISPASMGANVVQTAEVDPADEDRIVITVNTNQDIMYTEDGGTTWSTWDATLGFNATAVDVLWSGLYDAHRYFVAGHNGTDLDVLYSPNEGSSDSNQEDATLGAKTNITNLDTVKRD